MKLESRPNEYGDLYVYRTDVEPERLMARFAGPEEADDYMKRTVARWHKKNHQVVEEPPPEDHPAMDAHQAAKVRKKPGPKPGSRRKKVEP